MSGQSDDLSFFTQILKSPYELDLILKVKPGVFQPGPNFLLFLCPSWFCL